MVKLQSPEPSAVAVPRLVAPAKISTVLLASAVPSKLGVLSLVTSSVEDDPLSDEAKRSGVDGADGVPVSIVMLKPLLAALVLPAASVAFAVMLKVPSARDDAPGVVKLQSPEPLAVVVPRLVAPAKISTVLFASAVPSKLGVLSLVSLSVEDEPLSEEANRSGVEGALGLLVSIVILKPELAELVFPALSVAVIVIL